MYLIGKHETVNGCETVDVVPAGAAAVGAARSGGVGKTWVQQIGNQKEHRMPVRKLMILALGAVLGAGLSFASAPNALAASGGGCSNPVSMQLPGWAVPVTVTSCISVSGAVLVVPDGFISQPAPANCSVQVLLEDSQGNVVTSSTGVQCSAAGQHLTGVDTPASFGQSFTTVVVVTDLSNGQQFSVFSPPVTV